MKKIICLLIALLMITSYAPMFGVEAYAWPYFPPYQPPYQPTTYSVTTVVNCDDCGAANHGTVSPVSSQTPGAYVMLPYVSPAPGHTFVGFEVTANGQPVDVWPYNGYYWFTMPDSNVTITAKFRPTVTTYTVTVNQPTGGTVTATPNENVAAGTEVTVTANPADDGYRFVEGSIAVTDAEGEAVTVTDGKFTMPASDVTVTAAFEALYDVSPVADPTEGGKVEVDKTKAAEGETVTVTATPAEGYIVETITVNGEPIYPDASAVALIATDDNSVVATFTMPASDVEVSAQYVKTYTVTYYVDGELVDTQTVVEGGNATAPEIPEKEGYDQVAPYWNHNGENITEDTRIDAVYTINKYTVKFTFMGFVIKEQIVEHGSDAEPPMLMTNHRWDKSFRNITEDTVIKAIVGRPADKTPAAPEKTEEEANPNTGAPINGVSVLGAVVLLAGATCFIGKK